MEKLLISACLIGDKTRYDGKDNYLPFVEKLKAHYTLVPFCPEVEGGLIVPRDPAEIIRNSVVTKSGKDVTKQYNEGAEKALALCRYFGIRIAILKDGSPACGSRHIHDGHFNGTKIDGLGVTARLLIANGIKVYCETDSLDFLLGESPIRKAARLKRNLAKEQREKETTGSNNKEKKSFYGKRPFNNSHSSFHHSHDEKTASSSWGGKEHSYEKRPFNSSHSSFHHSSNEKTSSSPWKKEHSYGKSSFNHERKWDGKKDFHHSSSNSHGNYANEEHSFGKKRSFSHPWVKRTHSDNDKKHDK